MLNNLKVEKITSYFVRAKHKILQWWTTMSSRIWTSILYQCFLFLRASISAACKMKKKTVKSSAARGPAAPTPKPRPSVARQPPGSTFLRGRPTHRPISPLRLVGMGWTPHVMSSHCLTEPFVSFRFVSILAAAASSPPAAAGTYVRPPAGAQSLPPLELLRRPPRIGWGTPRGPSAASVFG